MTSIKSVVGPDMITGRLTCGIAIPGQPVQFCQHWRSNLLQFSGADCFARLLRGDLAAMPRGMYLEFTNQYATWAIPSYDRSGAKEYFEGLGTSVNQDFLRLPLLATPTITASGVNYTGNVVGFTAMTAGNVGVHGKIFSNDVSSYVVGGAIVAIPDMNDRSQDIILTRGYLDTANARLKPPVPAELVLQWEITCQ